MAEMKESGWREDEDEHLRRETIHSMKRRCCNWDYCGTGAYMITLELNDRSKPILGRLVGDNPASASIVVSELGRRIEQHFRRISEFVPEIEVLEAQTMPEHFHAVIVVGRRIEKSLGEYLRGFKIGATQIAREFGMYQSINGLVRGESARGKGIFADGFVDTILFDKKAVENAIAYVRDNPRRLWEKRANPNLFRVLRDLRYLSANGRELHFAALGNQALLESPHIFQVQVSRRESETGFLEKAKEALAAARHGAALISPCISEGERKIARLAYEEKLKIITISNMGFSPLYKPGGKLFEQCAAGNLLMLAPIGWPYQSGKKPMTRVDACVLNRIAQIIAGDGAVEINYYGVKIDNVDEIVNAVCVGRGM